jgi:predicted transcriptional regulator YheO
VSEEETRIDGLNEEDWAILRSMGEVARAIGRQFGEYCEVVVHSLEDYDRSIVALENGHITGRSVGGPMTDFALSILERLKEGEETGIYGPYYSTTENGRRLKSTTAVIRGRSGSPIGFLCINTDVSAPLDLFIRSLLPEQQREEQEVTEHFPLTARDLLDTSFREAAALVNGQTGISPTEKNKRIVEELYRRGIFHVKNGIDVVAEKLGISRYTVYNYIREVKHSAGESGGEQYPADGERFL